MIALSNGDGLPLSDRIRIPYRIAIKKFMSSEHIFAMHDKVNVENDRH